LGFGGCSLERLLPRPFLGLTSLLLRALRLAPRLAELPLRLPKFMLEALQLALDTSHLTLDRFDAVDRSILRIGRHRQDRRADCGQRAASAMTAAGFGTHARPFPLPTKHVLYRYLLKFTRFGSRAYVIPIMNARSPTPKANVMLTESATI
jgi:hypothetical protein